MRSWSNLKNGNINRCITSQHLKSQLQVLEINCGSSWWQEVLPLHLTTTHSVRYTQSVVSHALPRNTTSRVGFSSVPAFLCSSGEVLCPQLVCILSLSPHPLLSTAHFNRQTHIGESNVTFSMLSAAGHKGRQQCNKEHKDWQTESVRTGTFRMPEWSPKNCRIK